MSHDVMNNNQAKKADADAHNLKVLQKEYGNLVGSNKGLEKELTGARLIIWALVHDRGGKIEVADKTMAMAGAPGNQISATYEAANLQTVIRAIEEDSKIIILG